MELDVMNLQNSRFEHVVQQAPVGITILSGPDMLVEMANKTYLQIVDKTAEDFIGKSLYNSLPEVKEYVAPLLQQVLETGAPYNGHEFPVILNRYGKKELTYFNFTYQAFKDEKGIITGVVVVATEVTSLVRAKQSLQESSRQFAALIMQSPIAMTIFRGRNFIIELANRTLLQNIWRKTEAEVMGKPALEVFPELKTQKYPDLLRKVLDTGITHREKESIAIVRDELFYLDFEYAPLRNPEGVIDGIMITVNDVTEKVIARQELEIANERLRLAVEATGLSYWDLRLEDRKIYHSPQLAEIFGHSPETVLTHQQMLAQVITEDLEQIIQHALNKALHTGVYQYEARIKKMDGTICWIKTQGRVIYDDGGVPVKIIGTLRDITEEKNFAEELERQVQERTRELAMKNDELQQINAELENFAYVSSHDLQEPLRKIHIFADKISEHEKANLSERGRDYFVRIQKAASTMQTLIRDLLAYSKAGASADAIETVAVDDILEDVLEELGERIKEKHALVNAHGLGSVAVVPFQFRQLLMNLLSNSLKFARSTVIPQINISAEIVTGNIPGQGTQANASSYYHLTLADNGIGFEPVYAERIFDIFQRLNDRERYPGTGIGLAIVKKIVDVHKGSITASGEPGKGARFDVYIPVQRPR